MEFVNFLFSALTLFALGLIFSQFSITPVLLFIPIALAIVLVFLFGIVCFLSVISVFFRDISHILPIVMQASFFSTPILYSASDIPEKYRFFLDFNPFYYFVHLFRDPVFMGQIPEARILIVATSLSILTFTIGILTLKHFDNKIVFKL